MNTRPLTKGESIQLSKLNEAGIDSVLIYLTDTGLRKNLLDATAPFRETLRDTGLHDYNKQSAGGEKIYHVATLFINGTPIKTKTSFYRPKTKEGDPRFWPSCLHRHVSGGDVLAAFIIKKQLYFVNLSPDPLIDLEVATTPLEALIAGIKSERNEVAYKLLNQLRKLAQNGPLKAVGTGDTCIGRTIEKALGIEMNSSQSPDYYGIEIKSKRKNSNTRNGLFAQVPDWKLSKCKNFKEILDTYSYIDTKTGGKRLFCTVSTKSPNPQGLVLDLLEDVGHLKELYRLSNMDREVCIWTLEKLHERLQTKHPETFWIKANEHTIKGNTYFSLQEVLHTRQPSNKQFNRLIATGGITVDHMIKEKGIRAHERGPQFKVRRSELNELFLGAPQHYALPQ